MGTHGDTSISDIHIPHNWEYSDALTRSRASGFSPSDKGKLTLQTDESSLWMLTSTNPPSWTEVSSPRTTTEYYAEPVIATLTDGGNDVYVEIGPSLVFTSRGDIVSSLIEL